MTPPGSYRASLEKLRDCELIHNVIGYEAIDSLNNVRKTPKGSQGRRGLGADGQEWWCLKCLKALFVHLRERVWKHRPDGSTLSVHPLTSIQYWLIPERRTIPQYDGIYYTLQLPQIYLLAKWQGVKTFDELRHRPAEGQFDLPEDPANGPVTLYLGSDGESFYMDRATRDIRGELADRRVCEIEASDVRGYSLSEAFRRLDKKEDHMVEEKWKPIMAERKRKEEEEGAEREGRHAEGQLAGRCADQEEEAEREEPEQDTGSPSPVSEGHRPTVPVVYMGNELAENDRKRKRDDLDQSQEPARPSTFVPQASRSTVARIAGTTENAAQARSPIPNLRLSSLDSARSLETQARYTTVSRPNSTARRTEKAALSSSTALDRQMPTPTSALLRAFHASQGVTLPPASVAPRGVRHLPRAEESSLNSAESLVSTPSSAQEGTRVNANGREIPLTLICGTGKLLRQSQQESHLGL